MNELDGIAGDCHEPFSTQLQVALYRSIFFSFFSSLFYISSADANACVRSNENELIEVHFVSAFENTFFFSSLFILLLCVVAYQWNRYLRKKK